MRNEKILVSRSCVEQAIRLIQRLNAYDFLERYDQEYLRLINQGVIMRLEDALKEADDQKKEAEKDKKCPSPSRPVPEVSTHRVIKS